MYEIFLGMLRC